MDKIIEAINDGRLIDAIKRFRAHYGNSATIGLKEAKDAVMGIKAALERADELGRQIGGENAGFNPDEEFAEHVIIHSYHDYEHEYSVMRCANKCIAMREAEEIVACRHSVIVARVVAKSETVTTRTLKGV